MMNVIKFVKTGLFLALLSFCNPSFAFDNFQDRINIFLEKCFKNKKIEHNFQSDGLNFSATIDNAEGLIYWEKIKIKDDYNLYLYFFEFENNDYLNLCYRNLLNCFPIDCTAIVENINIDGYKISPAIFIIKEKYIVIAKIGCYYPKIKWEHNKKQLFDYFYSGKDIVIQTGCGGPLVWGK